jgi:hypothetical protein
MSEVFIIEEKMKNPLELRSKIRTKQTDLSVFANICTLLPHETFRSKKYNH